MPRDLDESSDPDTSPRSAVAAVEADRVAIAGAARLFHRVPPAERHASIRAISPGASLFTSEVLYQLSYVGTCASL